jgi:hypothetical protein
MGPWSPRSPTTSVYFDGRLSCCNRNEIIFVGHSQMTRLGWKTAYPPLSWLWALPLALLRCVVYAESRRRHSSTVTLNGFWSGINAYE